MKKKLPLCVCELCSFHNPQETLKREKDYTSLFFILGIVLMIAGILMFSRTIYVNAQVEGTDITPDGKASSTPVEYIPKILSDAETIDKLEVKVEVVDNLASKYAKLYDNCRFR